MTGSTSASKHDKADICIPFKNKQNKTNFNQLTKLEISKQIVHYVWNECFIKYDLNNTFH